MKKMIVFCLQVFSKVTYFKRTSKNLFNKQVEFLVWSLKKNKLENEQNRLLSI